jgi:hypothetical protein
MRQQLGSRCPECGAVDAPQWVHGDGYEAWLCPRCGFGVCGLHGVETALAAFYGPQPEQCVTCGGPGHLDGHDCPTCHGMSEQQPVPCARCAELEGQLGRAVGVLCTGDLPCALGGWNCGTDNTDECPADKAACWRAYLAGKPVVGGGK